jgi:hypothetical protein
MLRSLRSVQLTFPTFNIGLEENFAIESEEKSRSFRTIVSINYFVAYDKTSSEKDISTL